MRKLKLDALHVESFETSPAAPTGRGTVDAHMPVPHPLATYDIVECGDTQYFDCTLGCSHLTHCDDCFTRLTDLDCV